MRLWTGVERREVQAGDTETLSPGDSWAGMQVAQEGHAGSILGSFQALTGHVPEQPGLSSELVLPEREAVLDSTGDLLTSLPFWITL